MPQGKLRVKAKVPAAAKGKKKGAKGPAVSKRGNRPITPKKKQHVEAQKLKKVVSKTINQALEEDLRAKALDGKKAVAAKKKASPAKKTPKKAKK